MIARSNATGGADELSQFEIDRLIYDGVAGLQEHMPRQEYLQIAVDSGAHHALECIHELNLGLNVAGSVIDPFDAVVLGLPYPRHEIIEGVATAVAVSPALDQAAKLHHLDTWMAAASSGRGHEYPTKGIARICAASALSDPNFRGVPGIDDLIKQIDLQRPVVGKLVRLCDAARRHGSSL